VIVLQAAGARASGNAVEATLEKIENSGRQALIETRRLLGVLRDPCQETELAPQPGIDELDDLAATIRAAGLPVNRSSRAITRPCLRRWMSRCTGSSKRR
jgi:hypothetical protein